jgi:hypothetical protein
MLHRLTKAAVLVLGIATAVGLHAQQSLANATDYDEFIRRPVQQRRDQFSKMPAENKAFIVRTHAERWVAANKARLGSAELRALQEATAFVTPKIYATPMDPLTLKGENEVKASMRCRLNTNDAVAAFNVFDASPIPAEKSRWTYLDQAKCWIGWFAEGVVDYMPTVPK